MLRHVWCGLNRIPLQGADKKNGDGFAKLDTPGPWSLVRIPVVMMLRDDADTLLSLFE